MCCKKTKSHSLSLSPPRSTYFKQTQTLIHWCWQGGLCAGLPSPARGQGRPAWSQRAVLIIPSPCASLAWARESPAHPGDRPHPQISQGPGSKVLGKPDREPEKPSSPALQGQRVTLAGPFHSRDRGGTSQPGRGCQLPPVLLRGLLGRALCLQRVDQPCTGHRFT